MYYPKVCRVDGWSGCEKKRVLYCKTENEPRRKERSTRASRVVFCIHKRKLSCLKHSLYLRSEELSPFKMFPCILVPVQVFFYSGQICVDSCKVSQMKLRGWRGCEAAAGR